MRYDDPQLRRALAAQYALGTLAGGARRRFHRLLERDEGLQREVGFWEQRLRGLQPPLPAIQPRPQVWVRIAQGIGQPAAQQPAASIAPLPPRAAPAAPALAAVTPTARETRVDSPRAANQSRFWQAWAGLATAAALVLAVGLYTRQPPPAPVAQNAAAAYVALLQMPNSTMHWAVSIAPQQGRITVAANGEVPPLDGKSVELWVISARNGPVPIGLLPTQGKGSMTMPAAALDPGGAMKLAVSIEPAGGSPTGKPTGPVVIVTEAVQSA